MAQIILSNADNLSQRTESWSVMALAAFLSAFLLVAFLVLSIAARIIATAVTLQSADPDIFECNNRINELTSDSNRNPQSYSGFIWWCSLCMWNVVVIGGTLSSLFFLELFNCPFLIAVPMVISSLRCFTPASVFFRVRSCYSNFVKKEVRIDSIN